MNARVKKLLIIIGSVIGGIGLLIGIIAIVVSASRTKLQTVTIGGVSKELYVGNVNYSTIDLSYSFYPLSASNVPVKIYSEDPEIAKVEYIEGIIRVTAVSEGKTNVVAVATSNTGIFDRCEIIVRDIAVDGIIFFDSDERNEKIDSYEVKRDGSTYSIPFECNPIDANLDNVEIVFDETVFSSIQINQKKRTLDIVVKEDTMKESSFVSLCFKQKTTEGVKRVAQTDFQILIEPKKIVMNLGLNFPGSDQTFVYNHDNIAYLDHDASQNANKLWIKSKLLYMLSEGNVFEENFSTLNYFVYVNGLPIDIYNGILKVVASADKSYYEIEALSGLVYGESALVSFESKTSGKMAHLEIVGARSHDNRAVVDKTQNIGFGSTEICDINEYCLTNGTNSSPHIQIKKIESISFGGIVLDFSGGNKVDIDGKFLIYCVNGTYVIEGVSATTTPIVLTISIVSNYWDSRFYGTAKVQTISYTVKVLSVPGD